MRIPPAYIGESYFETYVGFDELGYLLQALPKRPLGIDRSIGSRITASAYSLDSAHGFECLATGGVEQLVLAIGVHGLEALLCLTVANVERSHIGERKR